MPAHRQTYPKTLKLLQSCAEEMRANPTSSELALWVELPGSKLGAAFRRQVVIAPFSKSSTVGVAIRLLTRISARAGTSAARAACQVAKCVGVLENARVQGEGTPS